MAAYFVEGLYETHFIGRKEFLDELNVAWSNNIKIFGIFGVRAVGKTRTVFEFIQRKIREIERVNEESEDNLESSDDVCQDTDRVRHYTETKEAYTSDEAKTAANLTTELAETSFTSATKTKPFKLIYVDLRKFKEFEIFASHVFAQFGTESKAKTVNEFLDFLKELINITSDNTHVLLLFDNAEDAIEGKVNYSLLDISAKLVQRCKSVRIIITATTNARFSNVGKVFQTFELLRMTDVEAANFLKSLTFNIDFGVDFERIVSLCAGLPLAIMMVGAELTAGTSSSQMVRMLADCRIKALSKGIYSDDKRVGKLNTHYRLSSIFAWEATFMTPGCFPAH